MTDIIICPNCSSKNIDLELDENYNGEDESLNVSYYCMNCGLCIYPKGFDWRNFNKDKQHD